MAGAVKSLAWWWGSLTLVSSANILVWFMLYREFYPTPAGSSAAAPTSA